MQFNIVCATDNRFAAYCGVMLESLFRNNQSRHFHVFVLAMGIDSGNIRLLHKQAAIYGNELDIVDASGIDLSYLELNTHGYLSHATYLRLYCTKLLPESVDTFLYLDCDLIVNGDISELLELDINDVALAGARDLGSLTLPDYANKETYVNAGVLLVNLKWWREHDAFSSFVECAHKYKGVFLFNDQDFLNVVFENHLKHFSSKYNLMFHVFFHEARNPGMDTMLREIDYKPIVIHYSNSLKPWIRFNDFPLSFLWHKYRRSSVFRNSCPIIFDEQSKICLKQYVLRKAYKLKSLFGLHVAMPEKWNSERVKRVLRNV